MRLVRRVMGPWRARHAGQAETDIRDWREACLVVLTGCLAGLRDVQLPRSEIGVTLDRVDRALFRVRDCGAGAESALKRHDPTLSARVRRFTQEVVKLRNETASFLIRAQGPTPSYLAKERVAAGQPEAYRRAVQEVGQAALAHAMALERDLDCLWADLGPALRRFGQAFRDR